jgi:hypothetical protein
MSGKVEFSVSGLLASVTAMTNGSMRDLQETVRPCRGAQVALVGPLLRSSRLAEVHYRIPTVGPNSLDLCKTLTPHHGSSGFVGRSCRATSLDGGVSTVTQV